MDSFLLSTNDTLGGLPMSDAAIVMGVTDGDVINSTSGYRLNMHYHWRQFPETPYRVHVLVGIVMCIIGLVAITGNFVCIYIFMRYRSLRTPSSVLVINLAVCDLLMASTGYPLYAISSFHGSWAFPTIVCQLYGFAGGTFGLLSINTLAAIAIDRYRVIVTGSEHRTSKERRHTAFKMVVIAWTYSVLLAVPPLFGWNRYTLEGFGTTCSFDYLTRTPRDTYFVLGMFFAGFVLPLMVIVYCYCYIFAKLMKYRKFPSTIEVVPSTDTNRTSNNGSVKSSRIELALNAARRFDFQTAKVVFICVLFYCLSWTPYAVVSLIGLFGDQSLIVPLASALPGIFAKASTMYNPLIYALGHPRFRTKLKQWWKGDRRKINRGQCIAGSHDGRAKDDSRLQRPSFDYYSMSAVSRSYDSRGSIGSRCSRCQCCQKKNPGGSFSHYSHGPRSRHYLDDSSVYSSGCSTDARMGSVGTVYKQRRYHGKKRQQNLFPHHYSQGSARSTPGTQCREPCSFTDDRQCHSVSDIGRSSPSP